MSLVIVLDFAISYSKKNGDAEIVVAMYPYFKDGFRDTDLAFFEKELDPYIGEPETMRDFYKKNPKLAEVCEKYDGIKLRDAATNTINGDGKPVIDDFCTWIKDESNDAVLEAIKPLIDAKEQVVDISNFFKIISIHLFNNICRIVGKREVHLAQVGEVELLRANHQLAILNSNSKRSRADGGFCTIRQLKC